MMNVRVPAMAAVVLALAACVTEKETEDGLPPGQRAELNRLLRSVQYARGAELQNDLFLLVAYGQYATPPVIEQMIESDRARLRANGVYVLGQIYRQDGDERALKAVKEALEDEDPEVRLEAAAGLLEVGDSSGVEELLAALDHRSRDVRVKTFEVLKKATGRDFGYDPDATSTLRRDSAGRFREYFATARN